MTAITSHPWRIGILLASGAFLFTLCLGCVLPRLLISDGTERWSGPEAEAARLARSQLRGNFGGLQSLATTQVRVIEVRDDPSNCDWGYPAPASGIVLLQTYTLFGIPFEQWTVTCSASWSSHEPLTE